jgi:hypothetical protein
MSDEYRNKMSKEEIGSMVIQPVLYYDWVVPDFQNWAKSKSIKDFCWGPVFIIQNTKFRFAWYPNCSANQIETQIWLTKESKASIALARLSISLIGNDGSEKQICSKLNLDFEENYLDLTEPDANLTQDDLTPKFLPNGELRIRGRIEIKPEEIKLAKAIPMDGRTLVTNLRKEFAADEQLTFTDCVLVRCVSEIINCKFSS